MTDLHPIKQQWIKASRIPLRVQHLGLCDLPDESKELCLGWLGAVEDGKIIHVEMRSTGLGVLFTGRPGTGKTTAASILGLELIKSLKTSFWGTQGGVHIKSPVLYLTYPEYMALLGDSMETDDDDRRINAKKTLWRARGDGVEIPDDIVKVLIIDDLGKEYGTTWAKDQWDHLLRIRYDRGLPTIVTTNIPLKDWPEQYGEAAADFAKEAFFGIEMMGASRR